MNSNQQHGGLKVLEVAETNVSKWLKAVNELFSIPHTPTYKAAASIYCLTANTANVPFSKVVAVNEKPDWVEIEWDVEEYGYYITLKFTTDHVGNINVELFIRPYDLVTKEPQDWILLSLLSFATLNSVNLGSFAYINLAIKSLLEIGKKRTIIPF